MKRLKEKKKKRYGIKAASRLLALVFFLSLVPGLAQAAPAPDLVVLPDSEGGKREVVYGKLDAGGRVDQIYVVNHFQPKDKIRLVDYGPYSSVIQLTGESPPVLKGDRVMVAEAQGPYYYQGNLESRDLPWLVNISYRLDGEEVLPESLSGVTGSLEMDMTLRANPAVDPLFFDHYALQISIPIHPERIALRAASRGFLLSSAGTEHQINYIVLPGQETDISLVMDVNDFAMGQIMLAGVLMSFDIDLSEMEDELAPLDELSAGIAEFAGGTKKLRAGYKELMSVFREILDGSGQLADGGRKLDKGIRELADGVGLLKEKGEELKEGADLIFGALDEIFDALPEDLLDDFVLPDLSEEDIEDLRAAIEFLKELEEALDGLSAYEDELDTIRSELQEIIDWLRGLDIPDVEDVPQSSEGWRAYLEGLGLAGDDSLNTLYDTLAAMSQLASRLDLIQEALEGFSNLLKAIPDLNMSTADLIQTLKTFLGYAEDLLEWMADMGPDLEGLGDLGQGLDQMKEGYDQFRQGLKQFIEEGIGGLDDGLQGDDDQPGLLDGLTQFTGGVIALDQGLNRFYKEGMVEFGKGLDQLVQGAGMMADETGDLRGLFEEAIKEKLDDFANANFEPVSFVSDKNTRVLSVQFVMMTAEIPPLPANGS